MKSTSKLLREQIKEMNKLLKLKDDRIRELEKKLLDETMVRITQPTRQTVFVSSIWTSCVHEYDFAPYVGDIVSPPRCKKCGVSQWGQMTVTSDAVKCLKTS